MIRHIVMWNFKGQIDASQRAEGALRIKQELESLRERMDGIVSLRVETEPLRGSNADLMLDSVFESMEALDAYQIHPEHAHVSRFVGSLVENRRCFDFWQED